MDVVVGENWSNNRLASPPGFASPLGNPGSTAVNGIINGMSYLILNN